MSMLEAPGGDEVVEPRSEVRDTILVVADISGYTRFASANRTALEHSQRLINELLAAVIREAQIPLDVAKLEGDAVFLYAIRREKDWEEVREKIGERLLTFFRAFKEKLSELARTVQCNCAMCAHVEELRLKVVVHSGQALFTQVDRFSEVMGVDVIIVHRLLKNGYSGEEYLLVTEEAVEALGLPTVGAVQLTESYEAIGPVQCYVFRPDQFSVQTPTPVAVPVAPAATAPEAASSAEREISLRSRRAVLWGGVTLLSAWAGQHWLSTRQGEDGIPWPLRKVLETNERLARDAFGDHPAPTFPVRLARTPRANGEEGLGADFDPAAWRLRLEGLATDEGSNELTLALLQQLPRVELVAEFKCIEGWSEIVQWAGIRLSDLIRQHPPATLSGDPADLDRRRRDLPEYVAMETPDGGYFVGLDLRSALHPQTLLAYEMNGEPLALEHGAPLRLVIPVKYGVKNIKRIGTIRYTSQRPRDYWAERGYDWYAGL